MWIFNGEINDWWWISVKFISIKGPFEVRPPEIWKICVDMTSFENLIRGWVEDGNAWNWLIHNIRVPCAYWTYITSLCIYFAWIKPLHVCRTLITSLHTCTYWTSITSCRYIAPKLHHCSYICPKMGYCEFTWPKLRRCIYIYSVKVSSLCIYRTYFTLLHMNFA